MKIILCHVRRKLWKGLIAIALVVGLLWGVPQFYGILAEKEEEPYQELTEPLRVVLPGGSITFDQPYFD